MNTKKMLNVVLAAAVVLWAGAAMAQTIDYLQMVEDYANTMIAEGRDTYGSQQSPLFASAMELRGGSHELLAPTFEKRVEVEANWGYPSKPRPYRIEGIRMGDRSVSGGNVGHDQQLYALMYKLSDMTGSATYAQEADSALTWWLGNCRNSTTNLMAWGEHTSWDFTTEDRMWQYGFNWSNIENRQGDPSATIAPDDLHEFFDNFRLWDRCINLNGQAVRDFGLGLWNNQIHNQTTGTFSRHAHYSYRWTDSGKEYPRHGGFYIETWARGYASTTDGGFRAEMAEAIESLIDGFEGRRHPEGWIPAGGSSPNTFWGTSNVELAIQTHTASTLMDDPVLETKMVQFAASIDAAYLSASTEEQDFGDMWGQGYGEETDARTALFCMQRYEQTGNPGYWALIEDAAERYMTSDPDTSLQLYPGAVSDAIDLLLEVYEETGDTRYLDRADYFGQQAAALFFDPDSPLPMATDDHSHYESITGGPDLMLSLANLHEAIPEPASMVLVGGVLAAAGLRRTRR